MDFHDPATKRNNPVADARSYAFDLHELGVFGEVAIRAVFERTKPDVVVHLAARAGGAALGGRPQSLSRGQRDRSGHAPHTTMEDGIRRFVIFYRNQH